MQIFHALIWSCQVHRQLTVMRSLFAHNKPLDLAFIVKALNDLTLLILYFLKSLLVHAPADGIINRFNRMPVGMFWKSLLKSSLAVRLRLSGDDSSPRCQSYSGWTPWWIRNNVNFLLFVFNHKVGFLPLGSVVEVHAEQPPRVEQRKAQTCRRFDAWACWAFSYEVELGLGHVQWQFLHFGVVRGEVLAEVGSIGLGMRGDW